MTLKEWCIKNNKIYLLDEWNYDKNGDLTPDDISYGSARKVWWKCDKNHSYVSTPNSRTRKDKGRGCPYCSNQALLIGYNDFESWCKQNDKNYILNEWDWEKNSTLKLYPDQLTYISNKEVWWKCEKNHSWKAKIFIRTRLKCSCPYCYGNKVWSGENDFETWCKQNDRNDLLIDWDYEKNTILPTQIAPNSNKKIWWKCERNHSWYTLPSVRINGSKCPKCNDNKTSFPEQAILYYVNQYFPDTIHRYKNLGFELDIYIPSIKTAIEYDGAYFHKKQKPEKESFKNQQCNKNNITLIRIREYGLCSYENCMCIFRKDNYSKQDLNVVIKILFNHLKINNVDIDVQRDNVAILEQYKFLRLKNSLAVRFPEIAKDWHPTKNGNLKPEQFNYGADTEIWWKCSEGHEWQARINHRVKEHGCPVCAGQKVLSGYNDFESYCKNNNLTNLLKEWNCDKNNKVPNEYTWCSGKKVWWKCGKGHEWQTTIAHRISGTNCPYCSNRKVIQGFNDFEAWCKQNNHTELLKEWDYEENNKMKITPQNISFGSHKKVHWICKNGHKWVATIYSRVHGTNCAVCSGKRLLAGYNDLETFCNQNSKKQYLLKEWNYIRNNINPKDVTAHCDRKVWWICDKCNYEWEATVGSRVRGNGCKQCGMQRTLIAKSKVVKCVETNQVYSSLTEAERQTKIERHSISDSCKDKQKTAGGYHWEFVDKHNENKND